MTSATFTHGLVTVPSSLAAMPMPAASMPAVSMPEMSTPVVGVALIALGFAVAPLAQAVMFRLQPSRRVFFARWGFSHMLAAALAAAVAFFIGEAVVPVSAPFDGPLRPMLLSQMAFAGALIAAVFATRSKQPEGWRALGFPSKTRGDRSNEFGRSAFLALVALAGAIPTITGLSLVWPVLLDALGATAEAGAIGAWPEFSGGGLILAYALALVVAPTLEEVFYRGFLQPLFIQNFSEVGGILVVALLFAAVHGVGPFLPLLGVGVMLGVIKLRTQRIVPCILAHAAYNGLVLALHAA